MRIPLLLFGLVLGAGLLLLFVVLGVPEVPQLQTHAEYPTLLEAADGAARIAPVWWIGAAFGLIQIGFFGACFALGMRRKGALGRMGPGIAVGVALYAAVFALLLFADRAYLADPSAAPIVWGFPAPTAVMLYLLWPVPLWFLWLYLRHFDEQGLDAAEMERLRRIAREVAREEGRR